MIRREGGMRIAAAALAALALAGCARMETEVRTYGTDPVPSDWSIAPGEARIEGAALRGTFTGNVVTYEDGAVTSYYKDGGFSRTSGGATATGAYTIDDEGVVCLHPDHGARDCAVYVERDDALVMIDQAGGATKVTAIGEI